jgi:carbon monoxide dehydrogenase subunit G
MEHTAVNVADDRETSDGRRLSAPGDPCVIAYDGEFVFPVGPEQLWAYLERVERFENRLGWLSEFRLEGNRPEAGSVLRGVVTPPLPYRMRVRVDLDVCERPSRIVATIHGDLEGRAQLLLAAEGGATRVTATWTVEMTQRPMRVADRIAHPLLQWGHDTVVAMTVLGFRRHLAASGDGPPPVTRRPM